MVAKDQGLPTDLGHVSCRGTATAAASRASLLPRSAGGSDLNSCVVTDMDPGIRAEVMVQQRRVAELLRLPGLRVGKDAQAVQRVDAGLVGARAPDRVALGARDGPNRVAGIGVRGSNLKRRVTRVWMSGCAMASALIPGSMSVTKFDGIGAGGTSATIEARPSADRVFCRPGSRPS
jgi:hypothetical protein